MNYSKFNWIKSRNDISLIIKNLKIKIVHSHGIRADYIISGFKNIQTCSTLHNYPYNDYLRRYGYILGSIMAMTHISAIKKIKHPIACSKSISDLFLLKNNFNIKYVQNGVDTLAFAKANQESKNKSREELGLPQNKIIFISVGHLSKIKDPLTIIKAFNSLNKDLILVFLGAGELLEDCKKYNLNNKILFAGYSNKVNAYLQSSDYFISSSLTEGMPNTVLEAMACGLPCILSDIEPHKEILNQCENNSGILFETGCPIDLKNKIEQIMEMDYMSISNNAVTLINKNFSAEIMSSKYQLKYIKSLG